MADEEGVEQDVSDAVIEKWRTNFLGNPKQIPWNALPKKIQDEWRSRWYRRRLEHIKERRDTATQIACSAMKAGSFALKATNAEDLGKALARFALAAADKILE